MGKLMILNGSPRAPQSNSKQYASIFRSYYKEDIVEYHITPRNHEEILSRLEGCTDLLLVFPLYADSIPVTLHNFLKSLEQHPPASKPTVSVLINCGFLEPNCRGHPEALLQTAWVSIFLYPMHRRRGSLFENPVCLPGQVENQSLGKSHPSKPAQRICRDHAHLEKKLSESLHKILAALWAEVWCQPRTDGHHAD